MKIPCVKLTVTILAAAILAIPASSPFTAAVSAADDDTRYFYSPAPANSSNRSSDSDEAVAASAGSGTVDFTASNKYPYDKLQSSIRKYQDTNSDVTGWLVIPGTGINEPILYSNKNNNYYEKRDWKGTNYPNNDWQNYAITSTYADYRTKWGETWRSSSRNIVLYGHNWTNLRTPLDIGNVAKHKMLGQLPSYTDINFAANNPHIYFSTGENEGIWRVFTVAYCELSASFFYNQANPTKETFGKLINEWQNRSMFDFGVEVDESDRILTLSTCTRQYGSHANQRFVVVARLLREGESEKDTVTVKVNSDMKKPKL